MIVRTSFDTPTLPRLATIIAELQSGVIAIPEFQRPSVWRDKQRLDLLDSIVKGLPIGSLLVWRSGTDVLNTYTEIAGIPVPPPRAGVDRRTYLIDGHQRVTTLFGALVRPEVPRTGEFVRRWPLYYELGTTEGRAFRLPPRPREPVPGHWLPLDILFDSRALYRFRDGLYKRGDDTHADEAERIANVFKDYIIPVVPLISDDLDLVTDAFVRINSSGSPMTEAHMLRALTYKKGARDTFEGFAEIVAALGPSWDDLPEQTLVNCLKAALGLDVYRSSVREIERHLRNDAEALGRLKVAVLEAVSLLEAMGVGGWAALPYAYQLVTLVALAFNSPRSVRDRSMLLRRWFWRTTYAEHFTGATGGKIQHGIELLSKTDPDLEELCSSLSIYTTRGLLRKGTVRAKAFLLFLAARSSRPDRRRSVVPEAMARGASLPLLFPGLPADPGNLVAASPSELTRIRKALIRGSLTNSDRAEFLLDGELPGLLVDESSRAETEAFINARSRHLRDLEEEFLRDLGVLSGAEYINALFDQLKIESVASAEWPWSDESAESPAE